MPQSTGDEIDQLISEITKLEVERNGEAAKLELFGTLTDEGRQRLQPLIRNLERLNRELDLKRQKLISLELLSISEYSNRMNQNIARLDDSVKSLGTTTKQLLRSSVRIETWSVLLILVAITNIALLIDTFPPYGFYFGTTLVAATMALAIFLWRKWRRVEPQ